LWNLQVQQCTLIHFNFQSISFSSTTIKYFSDGLNFGLALSLLMGGILAKVNRGWEYSYYIVGLLGTMWSLLWLLLGAHGPNTCTYLSEEERSYINNSLPKTILVSRVSIVLRKYPLSDLGLSINLN
jgi:hypothetical protein